ncbi:MAG: SAM-dependent methyltransferase [Lachnospiraceae bacterium]|nr:SAM-dependent methyltransferase [Lachnospiraceae bacterium]
MEELQQLLKQVLNESLNQIILSNSRDVAQAAKSKIRPVKIGGALKFQETRYQGTKVFHENYDSVEMALKIEKDLRELFRQCEISTDQLDATVLISKKGKSTVKVRRRQGALRESRGEKETTGEQMAPDRLTHNRTKQYILPEGEPVDFLIGLGVQTPDGRITKNRYDKFRQINRYLEFIEDVLEELPKDRCIHIVDFGCGKSYLTFAMYYYLHVKAGRDIRVTGLDLKEDVIRHCNELAEKLHYDCLRFEQGDIASYQGENPADMVVSLHACDTATDYAIEKAVFWGASVILAVPCCQHELNRQIKCEVLRPAFKYGVIKERMAALLTDAIRARILECHGYHTQILEFIDMEHTPKNLLIRAVKKNRMQTGAPGKELEEMERFLQVHPTLETLLGDKD